MRLCYAMAENVETRFCFVLWTKLAAFAAMCLDGTLKSCYNNLGLKSSDDDLPHKNAEVHTHLSENVLALNSFAVQNSGVPPLWLDSHLI